LDAGQVSSPKELENLQSEIVSLERRQGDLEEVVLEVMEQAEEVTRRSTALSAEQAELAGRRDEIATRRDAAFAEIDEQAGKARDSRAAIAGDLPADLLDLYDRLRAQHGVGAAALRNGRCEGCHLSLNKVDLGRIRAAPPDEVIRCEECRRILVREQNA
jgi:predicted  nucleic acid-binding Zn-ribbon protein